MESNKKHIFIVGAKSIGQYGGYETFLDKLTEGHENNENIQYYIATKANGNGCMDETKLNGVTRIDDTKFIYHNAIVVKLQIPQIGAAQAIYYDIYALKYWINYCKKHNITSPIFYVLACRIGFAFNTLVKEIHQIGGVVYVNPDGHEWKRSKWSKPVRWYWKESEKKMVKYADLLICDSVNIEKYIKSEYKKYFPKTTYISYGSDITPSKLSDSDPKFLEWLKKNNVSKGRYYMCCGRFVPENSFETMIREFMASKTERDFVIITTENEKLKNELDEKFGFSNDKRIKFVGTVYDSELLKKIRESAFANLHGHTVGGTNPSLLEALGSTDINLLIDVSFNREVAEDAALYWNNEEGNLASLIDKVDIMPSKEIIMLGDLAKRRINNAYNWLDICKKYEQIYYLL